MAFLAVRDLTFSYPGARKPILSHVDLAVERGEFVLLCGVSGSGKSTLLKHLKSALQPYGIRTGQILLDDVPLEQVDLREQAGRIGFVMQDPQAQIVTDKVWHELAFGMENLGMDQSEIRLRSAEMASYFGIQDWFRRETAELSGGQKQLLNLASVMAMQPDILILDEPTSQLDPIAAADFLNTLKKINRELGTAVLITEHRTEDVFPEADRVVILKNGSVLTEGSPAEVGQLLYETKDPLFGALPTPSRIFYGAGSVGACPLTVREGRKWLAGCCPGELPAKSRPQGAPALEFREAWFRYEREGADILRGATFSVPTGSLYAIVGGNGTGKSTSLKAACGICRLYRGEVLIFGKKLRSYRGGALFHDCLSMLPQDPGNIFVCGTVREDLTEMTSDAAAIDEMVTRFELSHLLDSHPSDLSGGELQRAAMAKVLLTRPRLLLMDEPTKGLDCSFKQKLAGILRQLCAGGMTIVLVSHDVEFCAEYADLVGMFFDGGILVSDTPQRFFGGNSFYTTAACRVSRPIFRNAVTAGDVISLLEGSV